LETSHTQIARTVSLVIAACAVCFLCLGRGALYYDEAIYAQVSKEIVRSNQWLTLHWNGQPWFHKPPIYFWATAVLFKLFGPSELTARFVSAIAGVSCVILTYLIAKRLQDNTAGFIAGLVLLSSALFAFYSRRGMTDVTMTAFVLLSVYAYLRSDKEPRMWLLVAAACAFAILTKGAAGLIGPIVIATTMLFDRRLATDIRRREFWIAAMLLVFLVGIWHLALLAIHGRAFVKTYLVKHVFQRSVSDLHKYNSGPLFYLGVLWDFMWPWVLISPFAIVHEIRQKRSRVILALIVLTIVPFTLATTKFQWYIIPALPGLSILIGCFISAYLVRTHANMRRLIWAALVLLLAIGLGEVVRYCRPDKQMDQVATLARRASTDAGAISTCPESLEMAVLYYSDRKLCADETLSPLSYGEETKCAGGEIHNIIFSNESKSRVESRFSIRVLYEADGFSYAEVLGTH
jgi:4-amino-4-deoxy-L-arabinose transferase-like glycosyltransferase